MVEDKEENYFLFTYFQSETDSYSERVDQMSIGSLYGQKRRDTLAVSIL